MAAHLPRLPVLLFVFLAAHVVSTSTHAEPPLPSTYDVSMCSESFRCGDVEISYPFYLANATEATADNSGNYYCGYTDLSVSCELEVEVEGPTTWTPIIRLGDDNYTVENILYGYDHQTISLAATDVLEGGDCPIVRHNVSFNETWLLYNTSASDNLTFFFGCHWGERDTTPPEFAEYKISCPRSSNPATSGGGSFVLKPGDDEHAEQELASHCNEVFSVPVRSEALWPPRDGYGKVLRQGFELEWNRTSGDKCGLCEGSDPGGRCAYNQKREFLGCLCNGGKVGNPYCKASRRIIPSVQ